MEEAVSRFEDLDVEFATGIVGELWGRVAAFEDSEGDGLQLHGPPIRTYSTTGAYRNAHSPPVERRCLRRESRKSVLGLAPLLLPLSETGRGLFRRVAQITRFDATLPRITRAG